MKSLTKLITIGLATGHLVAAQVGPVPGQIKNLVTFGDSFTDTVSHCFHDS